MSKLAFLGLGVMGAPMAGHLARAGHSVTGYNRTAVKAAQWREQLVGEGLDVASAATPIEAVTNCDVVLACLGNDDDVRSVLLRPTQLFVARAEWALTAAGGAAPTLPAPPPTKKKLAGAHC